MFLRRRAKVLLLVRGTYEDGPDYLSRRVASSRTSRFSITTTPNPQSPAEKLEQIELENTKNGEHRVVRGRRLFFFSMIGADLCTDWFPTTEIERDAK